MISKLLSIALTIVVLFSASNVHANLITGEVYLDGAGERWEYVTLFDLVGNNNPKGEESPHWSDADPVNGLEAAVYFLGGNTSDYALAAFALSFDITTISAGANIVNHLAWYDGNINAVSRLAENVTADANGDNKYDNNTDVSAWVDDRALSGDYINYIFKKVANVPEPSTLIIFAIALCVLSARRFKARI